MTAVRQVFEPKQSSEVRFWEYNFCKKYCENYKRCKAKQFVKLSISPKQKERSFLDGDEQSIRKPFTTFLTRRIFEIFNGKEAGFDELFIDITYKEFQLFTLLKSEFNNMKTKQIGRSNG